MNFREVAKNAKLASEAYMKMHGKRLEIRPYRCGLLLACCDLCGCPKVRIICYYLTTVILFELEFKSYFQLFFI